ncbi:hypothetical protein SERLADRAFT_361134 [Serpula lacrymans var. lacrymans S7.9]|uniref:RMT2 domain-containing protein n=1 Tax=Serpula lacrymans var. lacrymans (strain S7.9) TaxID=578457 RepID=F8NSY3_SERL9|nr:uncharacterized protein SERLADRAFT_361134 [Serpula lacrymans var. lacrymans S7.9]EGO25456.1 hypothetical protein SERLADRAFT_361134 [Serpula lacrymans var. lacrymans S7.9]
MSTQEGSVDSDRDISLDEATVDFDSELLTNLGSGLINAILEQEPTEVIKALVDSGAPLWYQDEEGLSPLHAAVYVEDAELVKLLIDEGAVWNAVDNLQNTAADIALSLNNQECYTLIRDAGIRSGGTPSSFVIRDTDDSAAGSTDAFISSKLRFTKDEFGQEICLLKLKDDEVGVMMGWEREISEFIPDTRCNYSQGLKILNVGFGLGIIDTFFQSVAHPPSHHVIIEPHPDVLQHMRDNGWYNKTGVKILEGRWQDFIESEELLGFGGFDVIYTDTFSENYEELRKFFGHLPDLMDGPESRFSFFNGLGATNALFYDVYTHLSELHLAEDGLDVDWSDVEVGTDESENRWGKTREYFTLPIYRLPVGHMKSI